MFNVYLLCAHTHTHTRKSRVTCQGHPRCRSAYDLRLSIIIIITYYQLLWWLLLLSCHLAPSVVAAACCCCCLLPAAACPSVDILHASQLGEILLGHLSLRKTHLPCDVNRIGSNHSVSKCIDSIAITAYSHSH